MIFYDSVSSGASLSAHKGNLRVTFFRYVRGCLTPRRGFFQSLRFVKASLRAKRESVFLSKGLISKPLVRLFYWQTISGNLHKRKQNKNKEAGETKKDDFQHCWKSSSVRPQGLEPWTH